MAGPERLQREKKVDLAVQIPAELDRRLRIAVFWESRNSRFTRNELITRAITRELAELEIRNGEPYAMPPTNADLSEMD